MGGLINEFKYQKKNERKNTHEFSISRGFGNSFSSERYLGLEREN